MNIRSFAGIIMMTAIIWSPAADAQGNAEQGQQLGFTCLGCHGIDGYRNAYPSYRVPRLRWQNREYMETALRAYRDGTRPHPTMHAQASSLTNADIDDLLSWLDTTDDVQDKATARDGRGTGCSGRVRDLSWR